MQNISFYLNFLISLVFIIALCSTILSIVYEAIAYYLKSRGTFLKSAIEEVLNDTVHEGKLNLAELLYAHPQIDLTKKTYRHLPAYISSSNFAQTLIDTLCLKYQRDNTTVSSNAEETAVIKWADTKNKIEMFKQAVDDLGYCDLQILLKGFITSSENNLDKLIGYIMQWYDEYMNRVSGWYKIKVQKKLFLLGIVVCITMNIDFFTVSSSLLSDKALTEQIANMAENYKPVKIDSITTAEQLQKAIQDKKDIIDSLHKMNAPVFWERENKETMTPAAWLFKGIGWLLMAAILSFGAPFWFEVLNKLVNIRKAGIKPLSALAALPGNITDNK